MFAMIYQSILLTLLRPFFEFSLTCKHPQTPGRIVSLVQGLCVSYWIAQNDYASAIGSTLVYFFVDYIFNYFFDTGNSLPMHLHHWVGGMLCYFAVQTQSWDRMDVGGELTRTLILMETTNVSFHTAFLVYNEYNQSVLMIPALLHFFVVRILRLGLPISPFNYDTWGVVFMKSNENAALLLLCLCLWALQIAWCSLWCYRILQAYLKPKTD
jgi:hypothetical protein